MPWIPRTYMSAAGIQSETSRVTLGRLAGTEIDYQRTIERYRNQLEDLIHDVDRDKKLLKASMAAYSRKMGDVKLKRQKLREERLANMRRKLKENVPNLSEFLDNFPTQTDDAVTDNKHEEMCVKPNMFENQKESEETDLKMFISEDEEVNNSNNDGKEFQSTVIETVVEEFSDSNITMTNKKSFSTIASVEHSVKRRSSVTFQLPEITDSISTTIPDIEMQQINKLGTPPKIIVHEVKTRSRPGRRAMKNDQLFMELLRIKQKQGLSKRLSIVDKISGNIKEDPEINVRASEHVADDKHSINSKNTGGNSMNSPRVHSSLKNQEEAVSYVQLHLSVPSDDSERKPPHKLKKLKTFAETVEQAISVNRQRRATTYDQRLPNLLRPDDGLDSHATVPSVHVRYSKKGQKSHSLPMESSYKDKISWQTALQKVRECHYLSQTEH